MFISSMEFYTITLLLDLYQLTQLSISMLAKSTLMLFPRPVFGLGKHLTSSSIVFLDTFILLPFAVFCHALLLSDPRDQLKDAFQSQHAHKLTLV